MDVIVKGKAEIQKLMESLSNLQVNIKMLMS